VRAGSRDCRKAEIAEMLTFPAERLEPVAGGDLAQPAFRRLARQPGQKAGHRGAVAAVRGAGAVELSPVLAGFWQQARIGRAVDLAAGRLQPAEHPSGGSRRVGLHPRARHGQRIERGPEVLGRLDDDLVAEMAFEAGSELAPIDEQPDAAVLTED